MKTKKTCKDCVYYEPYEKDGFKMKCKLYNQYFKSIHAKSCLTFKQKKFKDSKAKYKFPDLIETAKLIEKEYCNKSKDKKKIVIKFIYKK